MGGPRTSPSGVKRTSRWRKFEAGPSTDAVIKAHVTRYTRSMENSFPIGGPVTHLSVDEYYADKIASLIQKATSQP